MLKVSTLFDMRKLIHVHFVSKASGDEITYDFKTAVQVQEKEEAAEMGF